MDMNNPLFDRLDAAWEKVKKEQEDTVRVVRCRNCRWLDTCEMYARNNGEWSDEDALNWFCADGERKEE